MRKNISLAIFILFVIIPFHGGSINFRDKEMTLISFNVNIHSEIKKHLDHFDNLFPSIKNTNADKIIAKIKEQSWGSLVDVLQRETGMIILPISTFGKSISYDIYNFPNVNISKAQQKGFSKYYMKIDIQINPEVLTNMSSSKAKKDTSIKPIKLKIGEIKPVITITLTAYPNNGIIPIGKYIGVSDTQAVWSPENASIFDGLVNDVNNNDSSTLMSLMNEAINDLATNMLIK